MIDVKELRIGAHVMHEGKRFRVEVIYGELVGINVGNDEKNGKSVAGIPTDELDPIPLTAELLQELGFEKMVQRVRVSAWMRDNMDINIIGERIAAKIRDAGNSLSIFSVRYLHELEAFVYLTTKQELIKED